MRRHSRALGASRAEPAPALASAAYSTVALARRPVSKKSAARRRRVHTGNARAPAACIVDACEMRERATAPLGSGRELCAWLGGRCNAATASDCPEAAEEDDVGGLSYGELSASRRAAATASSSLSLSRARSSGTRTHQAATRHRSPPGGIHSARLLVIRDHWRNVGMGFMPSHVATVVLFALSAGFYVYVENYGRYDWTRYFHGHAGLDMRWTAAKHKMWRARFAAAGVPRTLVEVWHEDGSRRYAQRESLPFRLSRTHLPSLSLSLSLAHT